MSFPECSFHNLALLFQLLIILLSFLFSLTTIILIIHHKLYTNPYTFLILIIQSCYAVMAILDLLTKATTTSPSLSSIWCKIITPFIYGAIFSSFVLMELFVVMIFRTISKKQYGWVNRNVKWVTLGIVVGSVVVNCAGIPYYLPGFCNSCGFHGESDQRTSYEEFVQFVIGVDYYLPMLLVVPVFYLVFNLVYRRRRGEFDGEEHVTFKVLLIPILNFVVLIVSSVSNYLDMSSGVGYVFIFDSIYFVAVINFVFYRCFISFFELGSGEEKEKMRRGKGKEKQECCGWLRTRSEEDGRGAEMMYPYMKRESGY